MSSLSSVQPQENIRSVPPLTETNYSEWKYNMQARLMQSTISWLVVDGTIKKPGDTEKEADDKRTWILANLQAAGLIYNSVSAGIQPFIREHMGDSKKMWDELATKFQQQNATARFIILNDFLGIQKQADESLSTLIGRVDTALQNLCASHKKDMTIADLEDELAYSALIRALPEEFSSFRSSILLVNGADITYSKVKSAFLQEEQARSASSADLAMKASTSDSSKQSRGKRGNKQQKPKFTPCTYQACKSQATHSIDRCFAKQKDDAAAKVKELEKKLEKARIAEEPSSEAVIEAAEFAGNASAFDFTDPHSPLLSDAGTDWTADTGATRHMTPHRHWFTTYEPYRVAIRLADHKVIHSTGRGSVRFLPVINGKPQRLLEFHDVLHVPALRSNLLSVLYLTRNKLYNVHIDSVRLSFKRENHLLFTATINNNNAAFLNGTVQPMTQFAGLVSTCPLDESLWHRRFAHLNPTDVQRLVKGDLATGVVIKSKARMDPICEPCLAGKQHRVAVPRIALHRATELLALVHSDVHGPLPVRSHSHYRYWITFINDASRYWAVLPLKDKSGAFAAFKQFKSLAENQLNCRIKALRDDKGGEYMSSEWEAFCASNGIHRQHTVHAEPHQNGVAERANHTIMEHIIAMLNEAKLPGSFWWDALAAYVHVHNRSPTSALPSGTPYEYWHQSKPDV